MPVPIFPYTCPVSVRLLALLSDSLHNGLVSFLKLVFSHASDNIVRKQLVLHTLTKQLLENGTNLLEESNDALIQILGNISTSSQAEACQDVSGRIVQEICFRDKD